MSATKEKTPINELDAVEYPIGQDPNRHYIYIELDSKDWESNIEEYLDRSSMAEGEEGKPMYRVEADPRKDAELRKFTGSSKKAMLSCSKAAFAAWERHYAHQAVAVLRPRVDPREGTGSFTGFVDPTGQPFNADAGGILSAPSSPIF